MGVESQLAFTLPARPPLVIGIALSRGDEDFTDAEVALLGLARPHLIQAYRNAELATARAAYSPTLCIAGPWAAPSILEGKTPMKVIVVQNRLGYHRFRGGGMNADLLTHRLIELDRLVVR